jgi:DNA-binding HxlR family transcriptional regulator
MQRQKKMFLDYIQVILSTWHHEQSDPYLTTFFKSIAHWNVIMLIGDSTYSDKDYSYEDLCRMVPQRVASRATIQRIVNELIELDLIKKTNKPSDKRTKYLSYTNKGIKCFEEFVLNEFKIYKNSWIDK